MNASRRRQIATAALLGGIGLIATLAPQPPGDTTSATAEPTAKTPTRSATAQVRVSMDPTQARAETRAKTVAQAQARLAAAYRTDQVLVQVTPGANLADVAASRGLSVVREAGRSGYAALGLGSETDLSSELAALRADPRIQSVAPQGLTKGAGSSAVDMQQAAEKERAKAEQLEAMAQQLEATARALVAAGASEDLVEDAVHDAEKARASADKQWQEAEEKQEEATARTELERIAKIRELQLSVQTMHHPRYELRFDRWDEYVEPDVSGIVIAVLDTGVAYADMVDSGVTHVKAPSLAGSPIVAPVDLVNGDSHPGDDHQHGTHIASLIASEGDIVGLAPGATLMPIKVLDQENHGTELDLVEGIHHAVDNGADIINMSLSFGAGYVPSPALRKALERAHDAGIVMIAAAGNTGEDDVTWPAASHRVLAVGSAGIDQNRDLIWTPYTNHSTQVDLTATGGSIGVDADSDGFDDGLLAETIGHRDPSHTGYWFCAGTSQAAAVVTGAVARMMARGVPPADAIRILEHSAGDELDGDPYLSGWGAGTLDLTEAEQAADDANVRADIAHPGDRFVSVHPWVEHKDNGKKKVAHAIFAVVDELGQPVPDVEVVGRVNGTQSEQFDCKTDKEGLCDVDLKAVETEDARGNAYDPGLIWAWEVHGLLEAENLVSRPGSLMFATDGLEHLAEGMAHDGTLQDAALAIYWPQVEDEALGDVAESYVVLSGGAGIATSPFGLAFTPEVLSGVANVRQVDLDLDGSGIATSPFGLLPGRVLTFDGSGIATSPFGFHLPPLFAFEGSAGSAGSLGLHPLALTQPVAGSGLATSPFGYESNPILMDRSVIVGSSLEGYLSERIETGGWSTEDGYAPARVLEASGLLSFEAAQPITLDGSGASEMIVGSSAGIGAQLTDADIEQLETPIPTVE